MNFVSNVIYLFIGSVKKVMSHSCLKCYSLSYNRFYALAAAAALLKYIEFVRNVLFAPKSLKVVYQGSQNTMVIGMYFCTSRQQIHTVS